MKFHIKDENGKEYTVEEMIEEKTTDADEEIEIDNETSLTEDEIAALKSLAKNASKILELLAVEDKEHAKEPDLIDSDEDEDEDDELIDDEDEIEEDEEEIEEYEEDEDDEEVIDTATKSRDSKKSFGSIEKHKASVDDSLSDSISDAWAKRYNGGNK